MSQPPHPPPTPLEPSRPMPPNPAPLTFTLNGDSTPGAPPKRGRDEYWKLNQSQPATPASERLTFDSAEPVTAAFNSAVPAQEKKGNGTRLVLRVGGGGGTSAGPEGEAKDGGGSRATSPEGSAGKKRRTNASGPKRISPRSRLQPRPPPGNEAISANASPSPSIIPLSADNTSARASATAGPKAQTSLDPNALASSAALSIFAPPPSSALPEALQSIITRSDPEESSSAAQDTGRDTDPAQPPEAETDGDAMQRDAAEGFAARTRPTRGRDAVRAGVSATGKGVKVGHGTKGPVPGKKRKSEKRGELDTPNQDFCSACRGIGRFLCCDGCPRSFHFMCLEPPLRVDELPDAEEWFCKKCRSDRKPKDLSASPSKTEFRPVPLVFKQLAREVDAENPIQFRLPSDIRSFFTGVGSGLREEYVDTEETRTKYDRKGFQEERDGTRLRDGRARPVACYMCGGSSIPLHSLSTDPETSWRQIVSCDYCALHWHLDCLNPPLACMPNSGRKWMCPNHAEQVMNRRRTIRNNLETVDVESVGTPNNGNILVVADEDSRPRLDYEDMLINRKKYRVPEKIIKLDFWAKLRLGKGHVVAPAKNGDASFTRRGSSASDLTSLASGDDMDVLPPSKEDMEAANLILGLLSGGTEASNGSMDQDMSPHGVADASHSRQVSVGGQAVPEPSSSAASSMDADDVHDTTSRSQSTPTGATTAAASGGGPMASPLPKITLRMPRANGL